MAGLFGSGASSLWTGSAGPTENDYAAQIEGGLQKIASQDPILAEGMRAQYESREPYSGNLLSGTISFLAGKGRGVGGAIIEGLGNISTAFSAPFMDEAEGEEDPWYEDVWQGLSGAQNTYWADNLESYGMEDSWTRTALGVGLDIFADPTTYIGAGGLGVARETIAVTAKEIGQEGAKRVLAKEVAEQGGIRFGGQVIKYEDDFIGAVTSRTKDQLVAANVHPNVVDAIAGHAAHNADRVLLGSVDDVMAREVEEIGELMADTIFKKRNLQALPTTYTSKTTGRVWTRAEMQKMFKEAGKMNAQQAADFANKLYGGKATMLQQTQIGRQAAAAMGGIRLKFGIPFGTRLASEQSPFLAYRWQSNAIATRFELAGKSFGAADIGNFFRGTSGLSKLDNAIQSSKANGDGIWDEEAMRTFLHADEGGFAGLKHYMYNRDLTVPGSKEAFDATFGTRSSSIFMPWSERAGQFTGHLTPSAQAWRRDGYMGWRASTLSRTAKNRQKEFRQWASKEYVEKWAPKAEQLAKEAKGKPVAWLQDVYTNIIRYVEGTDPDAINKIPEYLRKTVEEIGPAFRELHSTLTSRYGVEIGDLTEVFARNKHTEALRVLNSQKRKLIREMEKLKTDVVGDKVAREALEQKRAVLTSQIEELEAQAEDITTLVDNMDDYDKIVRSYNPNIPLDKASPSQYFHRRFTREARAALIGNFQGETKIFGKAKLRTAELERKMATMSFREAEAELLTTYGEALKGKKIFEDNPFYAMSHYIEDMGEAVLKKELGQGFLYLTRQLGAIDNGTVTRIVRDIVDPEWMPNAYRAMAHRFANLDEAGDIPERKMMKEWLDNFEEQFGVVGSGMPKDAPKIPTFEEFKASAKTRAKTGDKVVDDLVDMLSGPGFKPTATEYAQFIENNYPAWQLTKENFVKLFKGSGDLADSRTKSYLADLSKGLDDAAEPGVRLEDDARIVFRNGDGAIGGVLKRDGEGVTVVVDQAMRRQGVSKKLYAEAEALGWKVDEVAPTTRRFSEAGAAAAHQRIVAKALHNGQKVPLDVLRDYPDLMQKLITVPKNIQNNPEELRKLQSLMQTFNKIRTRAEGLDAFPEPALKQIEVGMDMSKWGRLDVPGLEKYVMHPFMAAEFNRAWNGSGKQINWLRQQWRKFIMGPWKEWATLRWPGFHARNYMGGWFNNMLGGVEKVHYRHMTGIDDLLKNGKKSAYYGKEIRRMMIDGEMRTLMYGGAKEGTDQINLLDMMEDLGIVGNGGLALADLRTYLNSRDFLSLDTGYGISKRMKITGKTETDQWGEITRAEALSRRWKQWGANTTSTVENKMRGAMFLRALEESGDTAAARASVMMRHGDYDELTDVENGIKDLLPFYKWMRTNLPFQFRQLIENPGKQLAALDMGRGMVDEETRKKLPDWMRDATLIKLPWSKDIEGIKGTDEAASFLMVQLPMEDIFQSTNEFASGFLPVIRPLILENNIFKQNTFTGAPLEGAKMNKTLLGSVPGVGHVLKSMGIAEEDKDGDLVMDDRWQNVFSALPVFSRARNFIMADPERTKNRAGSLLSMFAGVGMKDIGLEELNDAEADYMFNFILPQIERMKDKGYVFPEAGSWLHAASFGQGLKSTGAGSAIGGGI